MRPESLQSKNGAQLTVEPDGAIFSAGPQPDTDRYSLTIALGTATITGVRLELLPDDRLPSHGPGRHPNGNPIISEFHASITRFNQAEQPVAVSSRNPTADFNQQEWDVARAIDGKLETGWAIYPEVGKEHHASFAFAQPIAPSVGAKLHITMRLRITSARHALTSASSASLDVTTAPVAHASRRRSAQGHSRHPSGLEQREALAQKKRGALPKLLPVPDNPELATAQARIEEFTKARKDLEKSVATTMVMREKPEPRAAHILIRGQYDKPGDKVERGLPAALPPLPAGAPMNRLGLAEWLVSKDQPLTARGWVNRAWEKFFGTGLVKTSENLGSQSEWPSHPELLDWLACEFRLHLRSHRAGKPAQAWDMKALQKLIVLSATYRQSARVTPELLEKDPENRLLARGPRFRLPAELIRDEALAVSGLLVEKVGGPSVRPYMPAGVWDETSVYGDLRNYQAAKDDGLYRRTLYTIWKRTAAPPTALLFDAPGREICTVKRSRTDTPVQALALLNEVTFVEAARNLAEHMLTEGGTADCDRLQWGFRRVTGRPPDAEELRVLTRGLEGRLAHYQKDPAAARQLIGLGQSKPAPGLPAELLAAYTVTANVLFNLDEFINR